MYRKTTLTLFCLLMALPLTAQPQDPIFVLTAKDYIYLHYLEYRNTFDHAGVEMRFGEIRLESGGEVQRINLVHWDTDARTLQDASGQIEQVDLAPYSRSEPFDLPEEPSTLHFYRILGMWAPSSTKPPTADDPPGGDPNTPWHIEDDTEWEIQLRASESDNVVMSLNTAGIAAHTDPYSNPFTGTGPRVANHSITIPAEHAGKNVYVQIVTRRWGNSPYGVTLMKRPGFYFNESAITDEKGNRRDDAYINALHDQWFQKVLEFCDSTRRATGWLPDDLKQWAFSPEQAAIFKARYYEDVATPSGLVSSEIRYQVPISRSVRPEPRVTEHTRYVPSVNILSVSPNPATSSAPCSVDVISLEETKPMVITLISSGGETLGTVWDGEMLYGSQILSLDFSGLQVAAGSYSLAVELLNGEVISRAAIAIVQ